MQREEAEARATASQQSQRSNGNENERPPVPSGPVQETAGYGAKAHDQQEVEGNEMPAFVTKKVPSRLKTSSNPNRKKPRRKALSGMMIRPSG